MLLLDLSGMYSHPPFPALLCSWCLPLTTVHYCTVHVDYMLVYPQRVQDRTYYLPLWIFCLFTQRRQVTHLAGHLMMLVHMWECTCSGWHTVLYKWSMNKKLGHSGVQASTLSIHSILLSRAAIWSVLVFVFLVLLVFFLCWLLVFRGVVFTLEVWVWLLAFFILIGCLDWLCLFFPLIGTLRTSTYYGTRHISVDKKAMERKEK